MKIGLLGAPGSGKSAFAKRLATHMGKSENYQRPAIVDRYVEDLEKKTGYALDYGATYPQNYQIIFHRWTLEQIAQQKGLDVITCGTMYESFIRCGIFGKIMAEVHPNDVEETIQSRVAMTGLGMIESIIYDYEALFYLPYDHATELVKGSSYDALINHTIPEELKGFTKNFVTLAGTDKENVKYAIELINEIRAEAKVAEDEQQSVRGSGETDQIESQVAQTLPDLLGGDGGNSSGDQGVAGKQV